ncbi:MAG: hypothetical protein M3Q65_24980, partial [Chloroflexota bacterium]|nr:hypothetical protein [Chloroflexota bacterium]
GLPWHGTLGPKTTVVYRGRREPVSALAPRLRLRWRSHLGLRANQSADETYMVFGVEHVDPT